ncbi:Mov34/MPN/PAD-1 family protein [Lachnoclostridium sp. An118]|uniref:Mov34/MPN/PAD-1 family protein n=1 Tax=Lachnoclostridium sp. An118 TaxID=1965547 RepID=UPI000B374FF3|nr:Mov34/MPN/PAD-1 family protein [Lachnoclostridium sp. An118]OUQ49491.1 hypothetical protein B5E62_10705 [Lachnoclostridium sp. An118]
MNILHEIVFHDEKRVIKITNTIVDLLWNKRQLIYSYPESGGILIGRENITNNNLIIEFATSPMPEDIQKRSRFIRKDSGHLEFYQNLYNENNGIYRYVGEWHTHSERIPEYSMIDKKNWKKILKNDKCNTIQYHLIAGLEAVRIWKIKSGSIIKPQLICTQFWRNIIK